MQAKYFDAHCHIQFGQYDTDREEVIQKMQERGVAGVVVGCDLESSKKAVELAEAHENLYASVGLHPNHEAHEWYEAENYRSLAKSAKVIAIGECGLDYFRPEDANEEVKKKQKRMFWDHIELAVELENPLIIHSRPSKGTQDAYQDLIQILKEAKQKYPNLRGDIHFFVGGVAEMRALTALGFTCSFTAVITFARDYDEVIRTIPLDMILAETDAPYVAPLARRGQRNDPLAVEDVAAKIAEIRGENLELVRAALVANVERLFNLTDK
jgi:TatD DNase family protein